MKFFILTLFSLNTFFKTVKDFYCISHSVLFEILMHCLIQLHTTVFLIFLTNGNDYGVDSNTIIRLLNMITEYHLPL